jgi:hypothetical protein
MPTRQLFSCTVNFTEDHVTICVKGTLMPTPRSASLLSWLLLWRPVNNGGCIRLAEPTSTVPICTLHRH